MWVPNLPVTVLSAVAATAGAVCIFKDRHSGPAFNKEVRAENKTVIVTGANSGIGEATVWDFARRGAKVFMACRDMEKCETARREIVLETGNKYVYCRPCDLASLASIAQFVKTFKEEEPHLHVLVNNAGVMEPPQGVTADGFETQWGVNHLGHFLLTNLLLDNLKASAPSRVIVLTSGAHHKGRINKEDLNFTAKYDAAAAYSQSKLANLLFARELAKRTLDANITVAAVDPGLSDTNLSRHLAVSKSITRFVIYPLFWPVMKSPKMAAQAVVHAALDPDVAKTAGEYFVDMKPTEPSKEAQNFELASWLWRVSEKWTRLAEYRSQLKTAAA
ncbi:retinol dehydrogenase 13-like [Leguminivora glycinivorella]|uniref:retinol dehydrogenase 13-like n=1 Tax=Leguminivora glycinivorella TaxID=1035111 RepID=UPI00200D2932|nr:retinol dehydrogenase 13-like [Leguminivora glycinivorella]